MATTDLGKEHTPPDQRYHPHDTEHGRMVKEMRNPSEKKGRTQKAAELSAGALCQIWINSAIFLPHSGDVSQLDYNQYCNQLHVLHQKYLRSEIDADQLWDNKQALLESLEAKRFSICRKEQ